DSPIGLPRQHFLSSWDQKFQPKGAMRIVALDFACPGRKPLTNSIRGGVPMRLWTYQPGDFRIDTADLVIDPARGYYWHYRAPGFRYREMLPVLQRRFGTDQFLWCYSIRGEFIRASEDHDVVEWALNVPDFQILGLIRASVWEAIVRSQSDNWSNLFVTDGTEA